MRGLAFASAPVFRRARAAVRACASSPGAQGVFVDSVEERSAAVSWPGAPAGGPFRVRYGPAGGAPDSLRATTARSVRLANLAPGTEYDAAVAGVGRVRFTTAGCAAPAPAPAPAGGAPASPAPEPPLTELSRLEVRVGRIVDVGVHPDADTLYVEKVDCGEGEPRTIVSGLVKFVPREDLVGRSVLVLCNLKPRTMRGVTSFGMLLCASNADHTVVDPLAAPDGAPIGELITFEGHKSDPIAAGNRASKAFDRVASELTTGADGVARYQDSVFQTTAGPCFSPAKLEGSVS